MKTDAGMKTAFMCFYRAYPPDSGAASVTWSCARFAGPDAMLIQAVSAPVPASPPSVRLVSLDGWSERRWRKMAALPRMLRRMAVACRAAEPDVVVLEGASWALYHLLLLRRLRKTCPRARVIYHAHNVEHLLRREKHAPPVTLLTRWAEGAVLKGCDLAFAVSETDAGHFHRLYGVRPRLLPNGVDVAAFDRVAPDDIASIRRRYAVTPQTILFMGFYRYQPNREAVDFLVREVMPLVRQSHPNATLAVLGGDVPYRESWLLCPGLLPHEEVPAFVKACVMGVAPIFSGSGTRLKILEYMAAGLPVVATDKGAEGLDVRTDEHLLLAPPNAPAFAAAMIRVLDGSDAIRRMAENGRQLVERRYAWPVIMKQFRDALTAGPVAP